MNQNLNKTRNTKFPLSKPPIHARTMQRVLSPLLFFILLLSACRFPSGGADTPTPGLNQTQAYETVIARITEVAQEIATQTPPEVIPTDSGLPSPTPSPEISETPGIPTGVASTFTPTKTPEPGTCDRAEAGAPIDVTIPDDTQINAGNAFVKTWRLINVGTCTWTNGYSMVFFSGEKMNAPDVVPLGGDVAPGQTVDISVNLTAPTDPGTYQGNWMLRNPSGVLFGIGPQWNSFFWVRIVVPGGEGTPVVTPTATATATLTGSETPGPTATPTPTEAAVLFNGSIAFQPDGFIDLDTGATNGASGNDISYTTDQSGTHPLTPLGGTTMGIFGTQIPTPGNCQAAGLSAGSLTVETLATGTYLCFRTEQGHYGWLRIDSFDSSNLILGLTLLTWQ
ncbi:MAG TPA: NBR1-Ig-like domain-containing protein [Anaerolineales bacterium]|nr:NBR1-Ig-like domain-containing protein [Anaerolineales bacterium]